MSDSKYFTVGQNDFTYFQKKHIHVHQYLTLKLSLNAKLFIIELID